ASAPARTLARIAVSCLRTCRLEARGVGTAFAGRGSTPLAIRARLSGRTVTLTASDAVLRTMRGALRRGGQANAAVTVVATAPDGVQDADTLTFTFRPRR
ncbi:MAG TPA: hypothetical protein VN238_20850, partial [Solirubrobacteraceae bacterium]|nr:hypothetical protein [Solirubrobacteraceae bacterium]